MKTIDIDKFNNFLSRSLIVLIPVSFVIGYLLKPIGLKFKWTAYPMLFSIMYTSSYGLRMKNFVEITKFKKPFFFALMTQLVVLPVISVIVTEIFYPRGFSFTYGHYALSLAPSAISTIIWSRISGGNIPLSTILVGAHALIVPYYTPIALKIMTGKLVRFSASKLLFDLLITVFIPTSLAIITYNPKMELKTESLFGIWSKIGLLYMIVLNTAIAFDVVAINLTIIKVFIVTGIQILLSFLVGYMIGKILKLDDASKLTLTYYTGMKNNGAGFVIIFAGFPYEAIFPLASAMMWQQPLASVINTIKNRRPYDSVHIGNQN